MVNKPSSFSIFGQPQDFNQKKSSFFSKLMASQDQEMLKEVMDPFVHDQNMQEDQNRLLMAMTANANMGSSFPMKLS